MIVRERKALTHAVSPAVAGQEREKTAPVRRVHVYENVEAHGANLFQYFYISPVARIPPVPFHDFVDPRLRAHDSGVH